MVVERRDQWASRADQVAHPREEGPIGVSLSVGDRTPASGSLARSASGSLLLPTSGFVASSLEDRAKRPPSSAMALAVRP